MCNCLDEITKKLTVRANEKLDWDNISGDFENSAINIKKLTIRLYSQFKITGEKKNTKGKIIQKSHRENIFYTYCPFCGCEYEPTKT